MDQLTIIFAVLAAIGLVGIALVWWFDRPKKSKQ